MLDNPQALELAQKRFLLRECDYSVSTALLVQGAYRLVKYFLATDYIHLLPHEFSLAMTQDPKKALP